MRTGNKTKNVNYMKRDENTVMPWVTQWKCEYGCGPFVNQCHHAMPELLLRLVLFVLLLEITCVRYVMPHTWLIMVFVGTGANNAVGASV